MPEPTPTLILTARITAAWLASHPFETADVPALIHDVHRALTGCLAPATEAHDRPPPRMRASEPARACPPLGVPRSHRVPGVRDEAADARQAPWRTHATEPEAYRAKWNLPGTYPMTAPDYSEIRSGMAKTAGLGRRG